MRAQVGHGFGGKETVEGVAGCWQLSRLALLYALPPLGDSPSAAKQDVADGEHGVIFAQIVVVRDVPMLMLFMRKGRARKTHVAAALPLPTQAARAGLASGAR